jgi:hypothetical protein
MMPSHGRGGVRFVIYAYPYKRETQAPTARRHTFRHSVLQIEDVVEPAIKAIGPQMRSSRRVDELARIESPRELLCRLNQRGARQRALSRSAPQSGGFFNQASLCAMTRQQLGLVLGNLRKLAFEGFRGPWRWTPLAEHLGNQVTLLRGCQMPAVKVEGEGDGIRIPARDVLALNSLGSADPALLVVAPSQSAQSPFVIDAEEPRYRQRVEPIATVN